MHAHECTSTSSVSPDSPDITSTAPMADMNLEPLLRAVDQQTASLVRDLSSSSAQVLELRLNKVTANLSHLRKLAKTHQAPAVLAEQLLQYEDRLVTAELHISKSKKKPVSPSAVSQADEGAARTALTNKELLNELNSLPNDSGSSLRRRNVAPTGTYDKLEVQTELQGDLSEDILEMVQTIKRNAVLFSEKITADNSVVESAANSVARTASKMDTVGSRLQQYRSSTALGWWFYIKATAFLVLALIVGMLLIQLFPKF